MESSASLPLYSGPRDHLRFGFNSLENEMRSTHPVEMIQNQSKDFHSKLDMTRRTFGSHMSIRLATEREIFRRPHRLPGLQSSRISLDILSGSDSTVNFEDFLSDPMLKTDYRRTQVHDIVEAGLGL